MIRRSGGILAQNLLHLFGSENATLLQLFLTQVVLDDLVEVILDPHSKRGPKARFLAVYEIPRQVPFHRTLENALGDIAT